MSKKSPDRRWPSRSDEPVSIEAASTRLGLPKSHLMKIAAKLGAAGLVSAKPGPGGGLVMVVGGPSGIVIPGATSILGWITVSLGGVGLGDEPILR